MTTTTSHYGADDLTHLEGLDAVRKRPGMYIGSTDSKGLNHLTWEIVDNAVDEALAGHCKRIEIVLHPDKSIEVIDDGRGIPVDVNKKSGLTGVELVMTKLHAGGKFGGSGYKSAGGLHGVGASVVNALSARVNVTVYRDAKQHEISFQRGTAGVFDGDKPDSPFKAAKGVRVTGKAPAKHTGTSVRFWYDKTVFLPDAAYDIDAILTRAKQTAFLVPGLQINVRNLTVSPTTDETFQYEGGVLDMLDTIAPDQTLIDPVRINAVGTFTETVPVLDAQGHMVMQNVEREVEVDIAFRWGKGYDTTEKSFVNVVSTPYGGTHLKGFERGLSKTLIDTIKNTRGVMKPKDDTPINDDVLEGLTAVISVQVPEPQFIGQTKDELGTKEVLKVVDEITVKAVKAWIDNRKTKTEARLVMEKVMNAARVRVSQKTQKEAARRKTALEGASMPAKLVDCRSGDTDRNELFIVEGDSALGTAKSARNSEYQALMPIRGKILNVQKATLKQVLDNAEASSLIQVLGAGSGRTFDIEAARYGRILLMADADVDGSHIRTLLLTLFARYMRPMIEAGRVYSAMPPLHKVSTTGRSKEVIYTYTAAEMETTVARLEAEGKTVVKPVPRYKGLGEMNADELWETTMDPATRSVRRVTMHDVEAAERVLELLMGDKVEPRRDFIIANADRVENIDI